MNDLINLKLSYNECWILDQMLGQAEGYPIRFADEKLGFPRKIVSSLFGKVRAEASSNKALPIEIIFSREEIIQILRAFALAFIETGPTSDLSTVTGYSTEQIEDTYNLISRSLKEL